MWILNMKKILITLFFILSICEVNAQLISLKSCTEESLRAYNAISFFLTEDDQELEEFRIESGTTNVQISEVKHVDDYQVCQAINSKLESNSDLQEDSSWNKYFYESDNFYFIVYKKPSFSMGYTPFIILDKSFNVKGNFGI